ncbi:hypothetical protein PHAMO_20093 [Magnetospirillum molischianum DSM 120]|uniref:Uncharacterized protein n=1 Tax=Magnetospirillum molischianum DSM 120 TaxID=1150626 RepID=H8FPW9_MAGML|nr:hypothetical protein PHAMO_20093 [Magnetospirillum molischianum DSM 120]
MMMRRSGRPLESDRLIQPVHRPLPERKGVPPFLKGFPDDYGDREMVQRPKGFRLHCPG